MMNEMVTHPPVVSAWTEVFFPDAESFSKKIFAVIGAFDVVRLREESVINVPRMPTLEVRMSMFVALTDCIRQVSARSGLCSRWAHPNDCHVRRMNSKVLEVHKVVCIRKGDLEVGCENFKSKKFENWGG
jgi:hypothetical protein